MARTAQGWWCDRSGCYFARLGEVSEATGKRKPVVLRDEAGEKVRRQDHAGRLAALDRLADRERTARDRASGPTVSGLCNGYIAWHREQGSAPNTISGHVAQLGAFCAFAGADGEPYGDRPAASIALGDLSAHRRDMEGRGNQTGYVRIRYASILACWRWAARPVEDREPARLVASNPFEGLARPRRGRGKNRALPWPTTRLILRRGWGLAKGRGYHRGANLDGERLRLVMARFIALTGCRPDEAARLKWAEVDVPGRIARMVGKTTSRTGKLRRISLTTTLAKALGRLAQWEGRHPVYVFLSARTRKTTPPGSHEAAEWFRGLRERLIASGLEMPPEATLYWLRHGFASFGVEVASVEDISAVVGNSPQVLMSTYLHIEERRIGRVNDAIDRARRKRGRGEP